MDMGIVKKRIIIDVGPQVGYSKFQVQGWLQDFVEFESFDSRIFLDKKIWRVFFWL